MNNNRNQNNNRRRGRGNRNQGGGGGGNQGNRIDSRARGNAPQMLDKYKKLAQDAQHHGDRVQAEYYLQFADHYFRVIADNRSRQDEQRGDQRGGRRDEREPDDYDTDFESAGEFGGPDRDSREREGRDRDGQDRDGRDTDNRERERDGRGRQPREARPERPRREFRRDDQGSEPTPIEGSEGPAFEASDNPFIRDAGEDRAEGRKRRAPRARVSNDEATESDRGGEAVAMPSFLSNDAKGVDEEAAEAAPRPRRKRSGGGTLSAVG